MTDGYECKNEKCPECGATKWDYHKPELVQGKFGLVVAQIKICTDCGEGVDVENVPQFCPCCNQHVD